MDDFIDGLDDPKGLRSRKNYTVAERSRIAQEALTHGRNNTARKYGIDRSMVGRWMRSMDLFQSAPDQSSRRRLPKTPSMVGSNPDMDEDMQWMQRGKWALDHKTKPPQALGYLEHWAAKLVGVQRMFRPKMLKGTILLFAADHGVAAEDGSMFNAHVSMTQAIKSISDGTATISVLCKAYGLDLITTDVGVNTLELFPGLQRRRLPDCTGTRSILHPDGAMTDAQLDKALDVGQEIASEAIAASRTETKTDGGFAVGVSDMGFANTTAAAALFLGILRYQGKTGTAVDVFGEARNPNQAAAHAQRLGVVDRAVN
ncbi:hypothetical protein HDU96_002794, partial [Phlyctochytrium bullatum]